MGEIERLTAENNRIRQNYISLLQENEELKNPVASSSSSSFNFNALLIELENKKIAKMIDLKKLIRHVSSLKVYVSTSSYFAELGKRLESVFKCEVSIYFASSGVRPMGDIKTKRQISNLFERYYGTDEAFDCFSEESLLEFKPVFELSNYDGMSDGNNNVGMYLYSSDKNLSGLFLFRSELSLDIEMLEILQAVFSLSLLSLIALRNSVNSYSDARLDALTGLGNRRKLVEDCARDLPKGIICIDVDLFKKINDGFGHSVGDSVLKGLSDIFLGMESNGYLAYRTGGDEFLISVSSKDSKRVLKDIEEMRKKVSRIAIESNGSVVKCSLSIGYCTTFVTQELALNWADHYLYIAKENGRNGVSSGVCGIKEIEVAEGGH